MRPKGYLQASIPISQEHAQRIKDTWDSAWEKGKTVVLNAGIRFVPLEIDSIEKPAVICPWCGQWAISQMECKHCGAKVL